LYLILNYRSYTLKTVSSQVELKSMLSFEQVVTDVSEISVFMNL